MAARSTTNKYLRSLSRIQYRVAVSERPLLDSRRAFSHQANAALTASHTRHRPTLQPQHQSQLPRAADSFTRRTIFIQTLTTPNADVGEISFLKSHELNEVGPEIPSKSTSLTRYTAYNVPRIHFTTIYASASVSFTISITVASG